MGSRACVLASGEGDRPRRSLILAGGGMRVAYQAGVIRALDEAGLRFSHADGTSGGTMNLAMLLSGQTPVEMGQRWMGLDVRDFVSLLPLKDYVRGADMVALGSSIGVRDRAFPQLGIDVDAICASTGLQGTFNVCNFTRKTGVVIEHQDIDLDMLVAGVSLPIFTPPVPRDGELYVDAVWVRDANLMEAVSRGAEEIWVVWCIGNSAAYRPGVFNQYVHMIEIAANSRLFGELAQIETINRQAAPTRGRGRSAAGPDGRTGPIRVHLIRPRHPLPLDPDYVSGRIDAATLIAMGYADACRYLDEMTVEGIPLTPEATRMIDPAPGVAFRTRFAGRVGGDALRLEVAADVNDLAGVLRDPDHATPVVGVAWLGEDETGQPLRGGRCQLFGRHGLTLDLELRLGGAIHRLEIVQSGSQLQATLSGPESVRRGEMRWSLGSMLASTLGAHATNSGSAGASLWLWLRFVAFMLARAFGSTPAPPAPAGSGD